MVPPRTRLVLRVPIEQKSQNTDPCYQQEESDFFDEQQRPRLALVDRKGAARLHTFDSESPEIEETDNCEKKENEENQELAEGVYGWDGEVEIHHQAKLTPYGWSKRWKQKWNKSDKSYLTTLSDIHKAEPPELTGFVEG